MTRIAIQPDRQLLTSGRIQSFSKRWLELAAAQAVAVTRVDVFGRSFWDDVRECDGFMWWFDQSPRRKRPGQLVMAALHHTQSIPTFPSWQTVWHFDDKVAQFYLLSSAGIPVPTTTVLWSESHVDEFVETTSLPVVVKFSSGITSQNVTRLSSRSAVRRWCRTMLGAGRYEVDDGVTLPSLARRARRLIVGPTRSEHLHRGYVLAQDFLPGNDFDTRVTIIGHRAFAFRRGNRPHDFRASGSGRIDWSPELIEQDAVRLAFRAARQLQTQSLAVDVLRHHGQPVIVEISYYYEAWAVAKCPGHWVLDGDELSWTPGELAPADAIFEDFVRQL